MSASELLEQGRPTRQQVVDLLSGHLCRCTGYAPIVDAILDAAGRDA
jgi:aerobic-type carbon monoxide dehydrogenase small subunit (CoxS/CutS family)